MPTLYREASVPPGSGPDPAPNGGVSTWQRSARQTAKRSPGEPGEDPVATEARAQLLVEADAGRVPVEDRPLHPATPVAPGDAGQRGEQGPAGAPAPFLGTDEQVLEIECRAGEERGVGEEVEREADRRAPAPADQRLEVAPPAEAMLANPGGRGFHFVGEMLVLGQAANQLDDGRHVAHGATGDSQRLPSGRPPTAQRLGPAPHAAALASKS